MRRPNSSRPCLCTRTYQCSRPLRSLRCMRRSEPSPLVVMSALMSDINNEDDSLAYNVHVNVFDKH